MEYQEVFNTAIDCIKTEQKTNGIAQHGRAKLDQMLSGLTQAELVLLRDAAEMVKMAAVFNRVAVATSDFERAMVSIGLE